MFWRVSGCSSIGPSWCRETSISQTAVRMIAVVFQVESGSFTLLFFILFFNSFFLAGWCHRLEKKLHQLSERLTPLGIMGTELTTRTNPLGTIVLWCSRGFRGYPQLYTQDCLESLDPLEHLHARARQFSQSWGSLMSHFRHSDRRTFLFYRQCASRHHGDTIEGPPGTPRYHIAVIDGSYQRALQLSPLKPRGASLSDGCTPAQGRQYRLRLLLNLAQGFRP